MRKSLSLKMFNLTLVSFLLLILGIMLSLSIYFNKFYEPQKINRIINAINDFSHTYESNEWTEDQLYNEVSKFMKNQNATMSIISYDDDYTGPDTQALNSLPTFSTEFPVTINNGILTGLSKAIPMPSSHYQSYYVQSNVDDTPILAESGTTAAAAIKVATISAFNEISMATSTNINGSSIYFPVGASILAVRSSAMEQIEKNGITYTLSDIPNTQYKQVDFNKKTILANGEVRYTYVNVSLQSVGEVLSILNKFYPYLIGLAVLISLIMAAVYSHMLSKPIIGITNVANRMASMEFGIISKINRQDELGDLSISLNTLSFNLKTALDDLVVANEQLKLDYESEIKQEKARKEFVANVSHELKTPLGVIKSYSEGIRDGIKEEKRNYYIDVILDEINNMDHLIIEMLELSKFDAGVVTFHKKQTDFMILLERTVESFSIYLKDKDVVLEINGLFGHIYMDEEKIGRVLSNLIGNAIKYCHNHSIITIYGEQLESHTIITIENDCPPLSEEALEKLWDRFYKVDTSHNREIEGTGLGLAITKSILEAHGCIFGVNNTSTGVSFYFTI